MFINAYYFRAHTYTLVPRHVREDMKWMADIGTDAVTLGILEQDLFAAVENIEFISNEAQKAGMKVYATPSRWGGLVAGCPKVPSIFSCKHPDALVCSEDGSVFTGGFSTMASVYHPATYDFFCESLAKMFELFPIAGVIWDEVKNLHIKDFSPAALKAHSREELDDIKTQVNASADFFDRVSAEVSRLKPDACIGLFIPGHYSGYEVEKLAAIEHIHDFGCDGRPFRAEDEGMNDSGKTPAVKMLCETGPYFVELAKKNNKRPLFLIENHAMADEDVPKMDKRLPEALSLGAEHLLYYYYPRSLEDPDKNMNVLAKHISKIKSKS